MINILAVDDAELILALQRSFIQRSGCRLWTATRLSEVLDKAESGQPHLIVLDGDPDGWGVDCCRALKSTSTLREIPVVLLASNPRDPYCASAGADATAVKAVAREALLETIRRFVRVAERIFERRALSTTVSYFRGAERGTGYTKDLSCDGLFLKSRDAFTAGDTLLVIFDLPPEGELTVHATGEVVRTVRAHRDSHLIPGVGLRFRTLGVDDRAAISRFVGGHAG